MFSPRTTFGHSNDEDKENVLVCPLSTPKHMDETDSSESDCMIVELDAPSASELHVDSSIIGILPNYLPTQASLILAYENRTLDVSLVSPVVNLHEQQRITISHSNYLYSVPKRHLYFANPCHTQLISIPRQSRVMYSSESRRTSSLGFICETPSMNNHLRHLILFDDGTAIYTSVQDHIHLSLFQDFLLNCRSIESKFVRNNVEEFFMNNRRNRNNFHVNTHVRVKKFDHQYHNARITAVDCSIMKLKFYERQAQTEIWVHQQSPLVDDTCLLPMDLPIPAIIASRDTKQDVQAASTSRVTAFSDLNHRLVTRSSSSFSRYQSHQCSPRCLAMAEQNFQPDRIRQNPYTLPFLCGWAFFHINRYAKGPFNRKPSTRKSYAFLKHYLYRSPCGRSFLTLDEVEAYLLITDSKLTVKFFVDSRWTNLESSFQYDSKYLILDDVCQGKESVQIAVYNETDSRLPDPFTYGIENRTALTLTDRVPTMTCCSCTDNCRDRMKCACWLKTFEQAKLNNDEQITIGRRQNWPDERILSRFGYIHQRLKAHVWSGIYECNAKCACHTKQCTNRVVQNQLYQQLQLFRTSSKGWGLRALHDIPHGSFINAYVGELITEDMAIERDYTYLAILDHKSLLRSNDAHREQQSMNGCASHVYYFAAHVHSSIDSFLFNPSGIDQRDADQPHLPHVEILDTSRLPTKHRLHFSNDDHQDDDDDDAGSFILDAKFYGSISRFYNHSCKPNVTIQNVFIHSHDPRLPVIALFACRKIQAGEELCWDYNYTVGCMPGVRIDCQCQAHNCRGRLL